MVEPRRGPARLEGGLLPSLARLRFDWVAEVRLGLEYPSEREAHLNVHGDVELEVNDDGSYREAFITRQVAGSSRAGRNQISGPSP
jgi:hypothetical protein